MISRLKDRVARAATRRHLLTGVGALAVAAALSGCNVTFGATKGVTTQAHEEFRLWYGMAIAGIAVAVFVWFLIFWAIFRYRRKDDRIPKQTQEHVPLEITYTVIPLIMVIIIFVFTVIVENFVDSNPAPTGAVVNVTAYQWGWIFQYAHTNGVTVRTAEKAGPTLLPKSYFAKIYPTLTLPVGETSRIYLRSNDVVHGFYVHSFNFDRYAQPGVTNVFSFTPTATGWFPAQCTQYCGLYHSEMLFNVHIVTVSQYKAWLKNAEANPQSLTGASSQPTRPGPQ